jgi:hypothetical protein
LSHPRWSILHRLAFTACRTIRAGWIESPSHKATEPDGKWVMKTQADYRKLAEDCVSLAQTATEAHRAMLLNMAHAWLHFADRAARDHEWIVNDHAARSDRHP